jgi:hypothetical protein
MSKVPSVVVTLGGRAVGAGASAVLSVRREGANGAL